MLPELEIRLQDHRSDPAMITVTSNNTKYSPEAEWIEPSMPASMNRRCMRLPLAIKNIGTTTDLVVPPRGGAVQYTKVDIYPAYKGLWYVTLADSETGNIMREAFVAAVMGGPGRVHMNGFVLKPGETAWVVSWGALFDLATIGNKVYFLNLQWNSGGIPGLGFAIAHKVVKIEANEVKLVT